MVAVGCNLHQLCGSLPDMVLDDPHLLVPSTVAEVEQKGSSSDFLLLLPYLLL